MESWSLGLPTPWSLVSRSLTPGGRMRQETGSQWPAAAVCEASSGGSRFQGGHVAGSEGQSKGLLFCDLENPPGGQDQSEQQPLL